MDFAQIKPTKAKKNKPRPCWFDVASLSQIVAPTPIQYVVGEEENYLDSILQTIIPLFQDSNITIRPFDTYRQSLLTSYILRDQLNAK